MDIYENRTYTYVLSEKEKIQLENVLMKTLNFLTKSGFRTFDLEGEDMEFLEMYCNKVLQLKKENEPVIDVSTHNAAQEKNTWSNT